MIIIFLLVELYGDLIDGHDIGAGRVQVDYARRGRGDDARGCGGHQARVPPT